MQNKKAWLFTFDPITGEAEAGGAQFEASLVLNSKFQVRAT